MNIEDINKNKISSFGDKTGYSSSSCNTNNEVFLAEIQKMQGEDGEGDPNVALTEELLQGNEENKFKEGYQYLDYLKHINSSQFNFDFSVKDNEKFSDKKISNKFNVNLSSLNSDDIRVFMQLSQKNDISIQSIDTNTQKATISVNNVENQISYKSIEVSKTLFNAIEAAYQTNRPVRLDFGNDTSVILKIGKDGRISADFIPNDKAMEVILRNALPELKAKFDSENLPYNELNYRQYNQQKQNKEDKEKNNDE
ncbi:MAG: hypothetical protein PHX18_04105 [Candidatus Gastranaerophilales bacterium]|nr:hypothetical protein [Candidatus Gastranaerophilales bacterium]